jgi:two-component system cell cycle response regulator
LEKAHAEIQESHWHLRKIQEVLPICMSCQRVKTGDGQWDELIEFFKAHSNFLSHSYCPECGAEMLAQLGEQKGQKKEREHGR